MLNNGCFLVHHIGVQKCQFLGMLFKTCSWLALPNNSDALFTFNTRLFAFFFLAEIMWIMKYNILYIHSELGISEGISNIIFICLFLFESNCNFEIIIIVRNNTKQGLVTYSLYTGTIWYLPLTMFPIGHGL